MCFKHRKNDLERIKLTISTVSNEEMKQFFAVKMLRLKRIIAKTCLVPDQNCKS